MTEEELLFAQLLSAIENLIPMLVFMRSFLEYVSFTKSKDGTIFI